jgi:hypothetical protein
MYGEYRCGKTQLCHTLCVTCQVYLAEPFARVRDGAVHDADSRPSLPLLGRSSRWTWAAEKAKRCTLTRRARSDRSA